MIMVQVENAFRLLSAATLVSLACRVLVELVMAVMLDVLKDRRKVC